MSDIPGINIIDQTSKMITVYDTPYHFGWISFLYLAITLILVIGGIFLLEKIPKLTIPLVLPIIICLGGFLFSQVLLSGFTIKEKEEITYTVTMDKTTPYIDLLNYELIEINGNTYVFKTKINP